MSLPFFTPVTVTAGRAEFLGWITGISRDRIEDYSVMLTNGATLANVNRDQLADWPDAPDFFQAMGARMHVPAPLPAEKIEKEAA